MKKLIILFGLMFLAVAAYGQNTFKYPIVVGLNGGTGGYIKLNGATSGSVTLLVPAVAGTTTFQFPTTLGTNGYVLTTNGSGVLSYYSPANWNTAYGWGNHASAGYLTSETSHAAVVVDGDFTSQGIMLRGSSSGTYSILTDGSTNWNTAYGWGDWSTAVGLKVSKADSSAVARANSYATGKMHGDLQIEVTANTDDLGDYVIRLTPDDTIHLSDRINLKANIASPTFTDTPAAPTAAVGTNTTQIASTAFVQAAHPVDFVIHFEPQAYATPLDNTLYYFGSFYVSGLSATAASRQVTLPFNCTLVGYSLGIKCSGSPTTETSTLYIRVNNTTDVTLNNALNFTNGTTPAYYSSAALNTNYTAADKIEATSEIKVMGNLTSLVMKNNILFASDGMGSITFDVAQTGTLDIDYNCHWQATESGAPNIIYEGAAHTWAEWQGHGFDVNGLNVNPLFVSTTDYHLQAGSYAINAGVDAGLPYNGAAPDLGAFELSPILLRSSSGKVMRSVTGKIMRQQ